MAPSGRRRAKTTRKPRRTQFKKQIDQSKNVQEEPNSIVTQFKKQLDQSKNQEIMAISPAKNSGDVGFNGVDDTCTSGCSTPKAKRFQIPEISTCPPAPMKRRPVLSNCSLRRKPITFFAPPDLELFFVYALGQDVSV